MTTPSTDLILDKLIRQDAESIPDPDISRQRFSDLWGLLGLRTRNHLSGSPILLRSLFCALSLSPFITQTLTRHPDFLAKLTDDSLQKPFQKHSLSIGLGRQTASCASQEDFSKAIRVFRLYHTVRIALRELGGIGTVQDTMQEMSNLADVVVAACLKYSWKTLTDQYGLPILIKGGRQVHSHFSVIDLGKLGGEELNFSSDIDILYVYDSEKGETRAPRGGTSLPNAEFYRKLSETLTRLVSEKTPYGFGFRVDLGLRPDGQYGDIANSLRSMEIYYESWGKLWERAVWIKARHGSGHAPLSQTLLETLQPFIYRKYLDFTAIEEIREMKLKIDQENRLKRKGEDDIKLGRGGIREIEFFVQAMQLIHAGKIPSLQCRKTLESLRRLETAGLVPPEDVKVLSEAYLFLRRLEHRIQLVHQRQTQQLPADEAQQERIARSLGFSDSRGEARQSLKKTLNTYQDQVHYIYENLFFTPSESSLSGVRREIQSIFTGDVPPEIAVAWLGENGFRFPEKAFDVIQRLREGPRTAHYVPKTLNLLNRLMPSLLQAVTSSPDPDMALGNLLSFVEKVGARGTFYALLLENPPVLKLLAKMFGSSRFLSNQLIQHPELLDELLNPSHFDPFKTRERMEETLRKLLEGSEGDLESQMNLLRRFKHAEVLRVGINDIYGEMDITEVTRQLSEIAEVCLLAAYEIALDIQKRRYRLPLDWTAPFVILGMGKMGGRELNYSSDLDLIFLFDATDHARLPASIDPNEFYGKLAQRFITVMTSPTVEGTLYEIDTRLRPSGTFGPIVTSFASFKDYHARSAWFWERQALIKARPIAGDEKLYQPVAKILDGIVYGKDLTDKDRQALLEIRFQMEREIAKESQKRKHIKAGYGGLIDIEFLIQYFQMKEGGKSPDLRHPNTLKVLGELERIGIFPASTAQALREAYIFLRRLENRIQILENRSSPFFNPESEELSVLARRMGYKRKGSTSAAEKLYEDYRSLTTRVRKMFIEMIGDPEESGQHKKS